MMPALRDANRRRWLRIFGLSGLASVFPRTADAAGSAALQSFAGSPRLAPDGPRWFFEPQDQAMIDWLQLPPGARVLDAGCGRGNHLQLFTEVPGAGMATGVDLSAEQIAGLRRRMAPEIAAGKVTLIEADVQKLPFDDGTFDLVWSSHVMHLLADPVTGVRELARVCRPGGRVVVREDGVSMRLLPLDTGIGEPGLESRAQSAFTKWFAADRLKRGRVPFGWPVVLAKAGLQEVTPHSFLFEVSPPFSEMQQAYLLNIVRRWASYDISREDQETITRLTDASSPDFLFSRDDLHFVDVATFFVGKTA